MKDTFPTFKTNEETIKVYIVNSRRCKDGGIRYDTDDKKGNCCVGNTLSDIFDMYKKRYPGKQVLLIGKLAP